MLIIAKQHDLVKFPTAYDISELCINKSVQNYSFYHAARMLKSEQSV